MPDFSEPVTPEPEGVSAFAARVLNQLSLSAWLPATFLTLGLTFLLKFRKIGSLNVARAATELTNKDGIWGLALLAVPTLVVATLLTQAFAFESIQLLEGYWHRRGPAQWLARVLIRWQVKRKNRLDRLAKAAARAAFRESKDRWKDVIKALELASRGKDFPEHLDSKVGELEWSDRCRPEALRRVEGLVRARADYPVENRILPTRLGNVLRSAEDGLRNTQGNLGTFVMRCRPLVPISVRAQHDQFRTRLEMYCTLVFVALTLTVASIVILWPLGLEQVAIAPTMFMAVCFTSYHAAIASARGYGVTLGFMDDAYEASQPTKG